ncbi:MAG: sodium ion-translocating decarboxylase subunit beta, partial [Bacilli bacterium]|nr:sodium ion-translocating decarboxylase subunit beta [Bacilli bacterium]
MIWETFKQFFMSSGIAGFFAEGGWLNLIMIAVACVLLFLAIKKQFEPYLLLPIAFGMLLVNLPFVAKEIFAKGATEFTYVSLAAKSGCDPGLAKFIFNEVLGKEIATSKEIANALNNDLIKNNPDFTADVLASIKNVYNTDYTGMFGYLYYGVKWGIYPCLIFLCIGATTDF